MAMFQKSVINKHLASIDSEKTMPLLNLERITPHQTDQMVYNLYELTKEEIKIVEESV